MYAGLCALVRAPALNQPALDPSDSCALAYVLLTSNIRSPEHLSIDSSTRQNRAKMTNAAGEPEWLQELRDSESIRNGTLTVECGKEGVPAKLTGNDLKAVANIIDSNPQIGTVQLELAGHVDRSSGAKANFCDGLRQLGEAIGRHPRTSLYIGRSYVGETTNLDKEESIAAWNTFLEELLASSASANSSLQELTLFQFRLNQTGAAALTSAIAFASSTGLRVFSVSDVELPALDRRQRRSNGAAAGDPFDKLFDALSSLKSIQNLTIGNVSTEHSSSDEKQVKLQKLRLVEKTCSVLQGIDICKTLRELSLLEMNFGQQGLQVGKAIALCEKLEMLELRGITFGTKVDARASEWDNVLDEISHHKALRRIALEKISLNDEQLDMLASCMEQRLPALQRMDPEPY
eukprot:tig00000076_g2351.t1